MPEDSASRRFSISDFQHLSVSIEAMSTFLSLLLRVSTWPWGDHAAQHWTIQLDWDHSRCHHKN
jgi:hypothetical protein